MLRNTKKLSFEKSYKLFQEALKHMPAGVSSNARLWRGVCPTYMPCEIFVKKAQGSHIWDVDNNEYIDYRLGFGPVILGHSFPEVHDAVESAEQMGQVFAFGNEMEINVAKHLNKMVPCAEMVRFANSGTEATMSAIRIARAFTGKEKIMKFEGHYHGSHDYLLYNTDTPFEDTADRPIPMSLGIPKAINNLVVPARWNNFEQVEKLIRKNSNEIAAIICEPVSGNMGVMPPKPGFLKHLRQLADENNIVLIFDEVKTGFRIAQGGAQEVYKVKPDIATYSKSLGNGYPVAAIAGRREVMEIVGPHKVVHGGTFSSNPVSLAAADATLRLLQTKNVLGKVEEYGKVLMKGIGDSFTDVGVEHIIQGFPGMFQFFFAKGELWEYRDLKKCDFNLFARLQYQLLKRGVMLEEDNEEPMFTCFSHSQKDLSDTIEAFQDAIKESLMTKTTSISQMMERKTNASI